MKSHRVARVAEVIREVAAETILFELQDPRIKHVTVTRAEVSADLQIAKVFVSVMGTEREQSLCMHGLKSSAGYVQSKLGSRLKTAKRRAVREFTRTLQHRSRAHSIAGEQVQRRRLE